jgi:anhydro-N-acetylmuramic acid kinase
MINMAAKVTSNFRVIGVMSGTSLDGLDLAQVDFSLHESKWAFTLGKHMTIPYDQALLDLLRSGHKLSAAKLHEADRIFGEFIGTHILEHFELTKVDLIASHGHTIFHQPQKGITLQIGDGRAIYEKTGIPTIYDFRSEDVALGGQGAPLVPIGDQLLFDQYAACLNLGGIANCSFRKGNAMYAYDIAPFNMALNWLSNQLGKDFDDAGELARAGQCNEILLSTLDGLTYYRQSIPKSLGYEDFESSWLPIISDQSAPIKNRLHTFVLHLARLIAQELNDKTGPQAQLLVTGGGAYHQFFLEQLAEHYHGKIVIPERGIIDFKEAIIFGFMGILKLLDRTNCLATVTGAKRDSSSGQIVGF